MYPDWKGRTVVCIASGPSLTPDDCCKVQATGLPTVAVNSSWKFVRFADVIYAGDEVWWKNYGSEIDIPAQRWTCLPDTAKRYGINCHGNFRGVTNSGARAVEFAMDCGAKRVLLLGFDCSVERGTHCHGDHEKTKNPDADRCAKWLIHFERISQRAQAEGVEIINCSRDTALTCFSRADLRATIDRIVIPPGE